MSDAAVRPDLAVLPELKLSRDDVYLFFERLGLGVDEFGYFQEITFQTDGTIDLAYLGKTIDDVAIDMETKEAVREMRRFRLKGVGE